MEVFPQKLRDLKISSAPDVMRQELTFVVANIDRRMPMTDLQDKLRIIWFLCMALCDGEDSTPLYVNRLYALYGSQYPPDQIDSGFNDILAESKRDIRMSASLTTLFKNFSLFYFSHTVKKEFHPFPLPYNRDE